MIWLNFTHSIHDDDENYTYLIYSFAKVFDWMCRDNVNGEIAGANYNY